MYVLLDRDLLRKHYYKNQRKNPFNKYYFILIFFLPWQVWKIINIFLEDKNLIIKRMMIIENIL